jgi:hypothetical protein
MLTFPYRGEIWRRQMKKPNHYTMLAMTMAFVAAAISLPITSASAADKVKLPATAVKLDKAGIMAAYGGKKTSFSHPNTDKVTGTADFSADMKTGSGTFVAGKIKGKWVSKITLKADQYCWSVKAGDAKKYDKPVCNHVYLDGNTAYEVDPKSKKILSVNVIQ